MFPTILVLSHYDLFGNIAFRANACIHRYRQMMLCLHSWRWYLEIIGYIFGGNVYGTTLRRHPGMQASLGVSMLLVMELSEAAYIFVVRFWVFASLLKAEGSIPMRLVGHDVDVADSV